MKTLFMPDMRFLEFVHISLEKNKRTNIMRMPGNSVFIMENWEHYLFCGLSFTGYESKAVIYANDTSH